MLVRRGNLDVVSLDPPGMNEKIRRYGVVAMCAEVLSADRRHTLDIDAEVDAVRVGLLGMDANISSPQLWLGALTMPSSMTEFVLEQLEPSISSELSAGRVGLVAAQPLLV